MKIPRIKIYLKIKYLFLGLFKKLDISKKNVEKKLCQLMDKKYIQFSGMCRTSFLVILEYLNKKYPNKKELIICSYNLKEMVDIARLLNFNIKLIDIKKDIMPFAVFINFIGHSFKAPILNINDFSTMFRKYFSKVFY